MTECKYVYSVVKELADSAGTTAREYADTLYEKQMCADYGTLPDGAMAELEAARRQKQTTRYDSLDAEEMNADLETFGRLFPGVSADDIPASVWDSVANGFELSAAYALYIAERKTADNAAADAATVRNAANSARGLPSPKENVRGESVSEKQVAAMTPAEVKRNYGKILKSIRGWK